MQSRRFLPVRANAREVVGLLLHAIPLGMFVLFLARYSANAPFLDDLREPLAFLNRFARADGIGERLGLIFASHNEHRLVFNRLVYLAQHSLTGEVSFRGLMAFGALGWVLTVLLFCRQVAKTYGLTSLQLLPVSFAAFSLAHHETTFWALASVQNYWFAFFAVLFLVQLAEKRCLGTCLSYAACLLTSGGGVVLWVVGNLQWMRNGKPRSCLAFLVSSTALTVPYFLGDSAILLRNKLVLLDDPGRVVMFFFTLLGGAVGSEEVAPILGILLLGAFLVFLVRTESTGFVPSSMMFLGLLALATTINRSSLGVRTALSPRYVQYYLLGWACLYVLLLARLAPGWPAKRIAAIATVVGAGYFAISIAQVASSGDLERTRCRRLALLANYHHDPTTLADHHIDGAAAILEEARRLGVYDHRSAFELREPERISPDGRSRPQRLVHEIDSYDGMRLAGFALIDGRSTAGATISVILARPGNILRIPTVGSFHPRASERMWAHEQASPAERFSRQYARSGFEVFLTLYDIEPGSYRVGIAVEHPDAAAFAWTGLVHEVR